MKKILLSLSLASIAAIAQTGEDSGDWSRIYLGSHPSVSPDGSTIAFSWCDRIWTAPVSGGTALPCGDGASRCRSPFFSPDGAKIAYMSDAEDWFNLHEMELATGKTRQITFHSEEVTPWGYANGGLDFICVASRDFRGGVDGASHRAIYVPMDARGAERLAFDAPALDPAVSPDGTRILFVARGEPAMAAYRKRVPPNRSPLTGDIWLYDIADDSFSPVAVGAEDCRAPTWTPDGTAFYYLNDANGCRNVRLLSLETGEEREITSFTDNHVRSFSLSADGRTMVLEQGFDFWRLDPTAEKPVPERIVLHPAGFNPQACAAAKSRRIKRDRAVNFGNPGSAAFTPDGSATAFTAAGRLWVMDCKKRVPRLVDGPDTAVDSDCVFSPDGKILYFFSDCGDRTEVLTALRENEEDTWSDSRAFKVERINSDETCKDNLSVSPDGSTVAWTLPDGTFEFSDASGARKAQVRTPGHNCHGYAWSPDGRYVAATQDDDNGNSEIWIVPAWEGPDAPAPYNLSRNFLPDFAPAWSPDGAIIAFAGDRAKNPRGCKLHYVYLDPDLEYAEMPDCTLTRRKTGNGGEKEKTTETLQIDFSSLSDRVRTIDGAPTSGGLVFSKDDPRTLAFNAKDKDGKPCVFSVTIPDNLKPRKIAEKHGIPLEWKEKGDMSTFRRIVDNLPTRGNETLGFEIFTTRNNADYMEFAFLAAWAVLRDSFCDPAMHGADWRAAREKYRAAARFAPSWGTFATAVRLMIGELDASHTAFYHSDTSQKEWEPQRRHHNWKPVTAHFGAIFDPEYEGEGWRVKSIVKGSVADRGPGGLLPGDIVTAIDGVRVSTGMDPTEVMNVPMPHGFEIEMSRDGETRTLILAGQKYYEIAKLLRKSAIEANRAKTRAAGNFGYIAVQAMDKEAVAAFHDSAGAECYGKDGLIIDIRGNSGGSTADSIFDFLAATLRCRMRFRGSDGEGYLLSYRGGPVLGEIPVVVLINEQTGSNGEIFAHAVRDTGRGTLVGVETAGKVIGTYDAALHDVGKLRRPRIAWFRLNGTDMENHGAKPHVEVDCTPADWAAGRDPQLDKAIETLKAATKVANEAPARPPLDYAP